MERPVPRRRAQLLPRRRRHGRGASPTGCSAAPRSTATSSAKPEQSVNFVTCHDGFTLNDLVSYNHKHNEANGEDNRDGANDNRSWNCGVEGPTDDPAIEQLRNRQVKNFLTVTLLSLGMPMLLMGDEVRRTQRGNNNAYCQDNETSWFDWTLLDEARRRASVRQRCSSRGGCCATSSTSAARQPDRAAPAGDERRGTASSSHAAGLEPRTRTAWRSAPSCRARACSST